MRTITTTTSICTFAELSDEAKETAKQEWAALHGYCWQEESIESIKDLAKHFGGKMKNWSIDFFASSYSSADFDMPEMTEKEIRSKLRELGTYNKRTGKGHGECKLTGYCADEDAIDGFRLALRAGERDLEQLMQAAFDSWLKAAQADCEWEYTNEQFAENCEANGYEFTEDGHFTR